MRCWCYNVYIMAKVGRKTEAQKIAEEGKLERRRKLKEATQFLIEHYNIRKAEIEPHGPIGDRWYEIFEETHAKTKMSVSLYEPSPERKAIKFTTFKKDGSQSLDMDLWIEGEDWQPFIEANKKFFAFIRRNK